MTNDTLVAQSLWIPRIGTALLLLVAANLLAWRSIDPDLWGHIQYGEDWIAEGALPRLASHTYSAAGHPWVNHENLSELVLALMQRTVGGLGIMVGKLIAGLCVLGLMMWLAVRRGVPLWAAAVCMVPVSSGLAEFWLARPQLASFLGMAALLTICEFSFSADGSGRLNRPQLLWLCVPLTVVWTNSHGGFAAGLCVMLAIFGVHAGQCLVRRDPDRTRTFVLLASVSAASFAAVLANPYGIGLPAWMAASLGKPRPEISEWASILNGGPAAIPFTVLTVLTAASLVCSRLPRDPARIVVLLLVAVQAAMHIRHIAFLAILFGFWMPPHLWAAGQRWMAWRVARTGRNPADDPPLTRGALALLGLEAGVVAIILAGCLGWRLAGFGVDRSRYPVSAVEWMAENGVSGRLIVTFNWAQYALAALNPDTTVCFDGRFRTCYPQDVIDMNFDLTNGTGGRFRSRSDVSRALDPARVLDFRDPQLVLLDRKLDVPGTQLMAGTDGWTLLYRDAIAELWGREDEFGRPGSARFIPENDRSVGDAPQTGIAAWPAFPGREGRLAFVAPAAADSSQTAAFAMQ